MVLNHFQEFTKHIVSKKFQGWKIVALEQD